MRSLRSRMRSLAWLPWRTDSSTAAQPPLPAADLKGMTRTTLAVTPGITEPGPQGSLPGVLSGHPRLMMRLQPRGSRLTQTTGSQDMNQTQGINQMETLWLMLVERMMDPALDR